MDRTQYTGFVLRCSGGKRLLLWAKSLLPVSPLMAQAFVLALATLAAAGGKAPAQDANGRLNAADPASAILTHRLKSGMFEYVLA